MKDIRLALTGFGSVGQGVATLLVQQGAEYERKYGVRFLLTGVADRSGGAANDGGLDPASLLAAKRQSGTVATAAGGERGLRGEALLAQAKAMVLLEAASTNFDDAEPGWSYTQSALKGGMDVVLASKGALVLHWNQVMRLARSSGCIVKFSATVGAPLPVLELPERMLIGVQTLGFEGIVNATSNYILTAMADGASYHDAVRQAQQLGIAETDPTLDVDGWDAAAKAVIIANAVLGASLGLRDVTRQGIRAVDRAELQEAMAQGKTIKLIARAERTAGGVRAQVAPERRLADDALGRLRGAEMGIVYNTDQLGLVAATVQRTGGLATALTMLRDVVNLARARGWSGPSP